MGAYSKLWRKETKWKKEWRITGDKETTKNGKGQRKWRNGCEAVDGNWSWKEKWEDTIITGENESKGKPIKAGRGMNE